MYVHVLASLTSLPAEGATAWWWPYLMYCMMFTMTMFYYQQLLSPVLHLPPLSVEPHVTRSVPALYVMPLDVECIAVLIVQKYNVALLCAYTNNIILYRCMSCIHILLYTWSGMLLVVKWCLLGVGKMITDVASSFNWNHKNFHSETSYFMQIFYLEHSIHIIRMHYGLCQEHISFF